jgi:DNA-binding PadR family transcriptional regulator
MLRSQKVIFSNQKVKEKDREYHALGEMEFYGLVESSTSRDGSTFYSVGGKGYEYLELWRRIRVLVGR